MNKIIKRAFLYIINNSKNFLNLILLTCILTLILTNAIFLILMNKSKNNFFHNIPIQVQITKDIHTDNFDKLDSKLIHEIEKDSIVKYIEYSSNWEHTSENIKPISTARIESTQEDVTTFLSNSISTEKFKDYSEGRIEIIEGRNFTREEVLNGYEGVLISKTLAAKNELTLGNNIEICFVDQNDTDKLNLVIIGIYNNANILNQDSIYNNTKSDEKTDFINNLEMLSKNNLENKIYFPDKIIEELNFHDPQDFATKDVFIYFNNVSDMKNFLQKYQDKLPYGYKFNSSVEILELMNSSMDSLIHMINNFSIVSIAFFIVLFFIIEYIQLKERTKEIGIYLVEGEKNKDIVLQVMLESFLLISISSLIMIFFVYIIKAGYIERFLEGEFLSAVSVNVSKTYSYRMEMINSFDVKKSVVLSISLLEIIKYIPAIMSIILIIKCLISYFFVKNTSIKVLLMM